MSQTAISKETLIAQLQWRYATKAFDPAKKISAADWTALEEALILSPSSYGMQPYHFLVITDQAIREKLVPVSWNQRQPADCSHYVVFATRTANSETDVDEYMARIAEVRGVTAESMGFFKNMLMSDVVNGARGKVAAEWSPVVNVEGFKATRGDAERLMNHGVVIAIVDGVAGRRQLS